MVRSQSNPVSVMVMHFGHFLSLDLIMTSEQGHQLTNIRDPDLTGFLLQILIAVI